MNESGIPEWWSNITEFSAIIQTRTSVRHILKQLDNQQSSVQLSGNILVVFTVLMTGLLISLCAAASKCLIKFANVIIG